MSAYELLDRLGTDGGVRALLVSASNPVVSAPNARHVEERLRALDFLVVTDIFLSETAQLADVVLPTTQWAEESGTMTNPEGRVLLRRKAVDAAAGGALATCRSGGGSPTGSAGAASSRPSRRRSSPSCAGPARAGSPTTPGSPTSASPPARRSSGRARPRTTPAPRACSSTASPRPTAAPTSSPSAPGRRRAARRGPPVPAHHRPGPRAVPVGHADPAQPDPRRGRPAPVRRAAPGAGPRARHRRGRPGAPVHPAWRAPSSTPASTPASGRTRCSCPFHWGGAACVNALVSDALDPTSRMPEFKTCPVARGEGRPARRAERRERSARPSSRT